MVYLPLTPTTYPHTLTNSMVIYMDVSLKGSTLRPGAGNAVTWMAATRATRAAMKAPTPHHAAPAPTGIEFPSRGWRASFLVDLAGSATFQLRAQALFVIHAVHP